MKYYEKLRKEYDSWERAEPEHPSYDYFEFICKDTGMVLKVTCEDVDVFFGKAHIKKLHNWLKRPNKDLKLFRGKYNGITIKLPDQKEFPNSNSCSLIISDSWENEYTSLDIKRFKTWFLKMVEVLK